MTGVIVNGRCDIAAIVWGLPDQYEINQDCKLGAKPGGKGKIANNVLIE